MADQMDNALCERVRTRLHDDALLNARDIQVDVVDGIVILTGLVHAGADIELAGMLARAAAGPAEVLNKLVHGADLERKPRDDGAPKADLSNFHM